MQHNPVTVNAQDLDLFRLACSNQPRPSHTAKYLKRARKVERCFLVPPASSVTFSQTFIHLSSPTQIHSSTVTNLNSASSDEKPSPALSFLRLPVPAALPGLCQPQQPLKSVPSPFAQAGHRHPWLPALLSPGDSLLPHNCERRKGDLQKAAR